MNIWECKIGMADGVQGGADFPMRQAVRKAYLEITGKEPDFIFSGWGAKLNESERAFVERETPDAKGNEMSAITATMWALRRKRDGFIRGASAIPPTEDSLKIAEIDGDFYEPLFSAQDVGVFIAHHRAEQRKADAKLCRDIGHMPDADWPTASTCASQIESQPSPSAT